MEFTVEDSFKATPERLYNAWLDSDDHSEMTGGDALITDELDDKYTAWNGYIWGKTVELIPNKFIKQTWMTDEFEEDQDYSLIEVFFTEDGPNTKVTIKHSGLTENDKKYEQGWIDNYFKPMHDFFD